MEGEEYVNRRLLPKAVPLDADWSKQAGTLQLFRYVKMLISDPTLGQLIKRTKYLITKCLPNAHTHTHTQHTPLLYHVPATKSTKSLCCQGHQCQIGHFDYIQTVCVCVCERERGGGRESLECACCFPLPNADMIIKCLPCGISEFALP